MMMKRIYIVRIIFLLVTSLHPSSGGFIDPDTPLDKRTTKSFIDGSTYHLVMSDEFNVENRTFTDGHDPMWTALDKSDDDASSAGGGSLQFYNSTSVRTENGMLRISTGLAKTTWVRYDEVKKVWKHEQTNFTSGMVQSWEKFCFTGGIVEIDVIFPGEPYIGGLWPAVWMLGNLGRATYEASTNNIWPWSYNKCDRELQQAQTISACNNQNHYGMHPNQGRGATEIDIAEVMTGYTTKPLTGTNPPLRYPYCDLTLQVAPGVLKNRPQSGKAPLKKSIISPNGHTEFLANTWYDGLEMHGNTSINPFFYGTYLGETKPNEPVTRTKKQAFQADAVGVGHQLTPSHFEKPHTFRLEWQPGPGGRLDWFVQSHRYNATEGYERDGDGKDWLLAYSLKDKTLSDLMGSQIPLEPTYFIFNTAISSTWGFPYDTPDWCPKCFDCDDPKCACAFYPGFCQMLRSGKTAMYIDHIRVYQSRDPDAHVGAHHTLGCDPPDFPTKEWIIGHEYRYMRNPPFVFKDKHPLRRVQRGGGECTSDADCGGNIRNPNLTALYESSIDGEDIHAKLMHEPSEGRGKCALGLTTGMLISRPTSRVCSCNPGFTGPHCLAIAHIDDTPSANKIHKGFSPFASIRSFETPRFMLGALIVLFGLLMSLVLTRVFEEKNARSAKFVQSYGKDPLNDERIPLTSAVNI